jgi:phospho-N-acetylmuramoyl-pentapeptide-transferase
MLAAITALVFVMIFGHPIIVALFRRRFRDTGGEYASLDTSSKRGTPTGGGLLIILAATLALLLWGNWNSAYLLVALASFLYFGLVGFLDDLQKVRFKSSLLGLGQMAKTVMQLLFIVPFALFFISSWNPVPAEWRTPVFLPFVKNAVLEPAPLVFAAFVVFAFFSIVNAVNITDGLDGLVSGPSIMTLSLYGIFGYILGNKVLSGYLLFHYFPGSGELTVFCGALVGALLGFLWYNTYPAEVFMGDTGSLALGGSMAALAFLTRQEMLFPIVGGVFVAMIGSSLLQEKVGMRIGRRIFLRAPLHHSLTYKGVAEPKVVTRIWIISILLTILAALSLKMR